MASTEPTVPSRAAPNPPISEKKATATVATSGIAKKKKKKPYKRVKSATVQLGLTFVSIDDLRSHKWRGENMFDFEGPKQQRATTIPETALREIVRRSEGEEGNIDEAEVTAVLERHA